MGGACFKPREVGGNPPVNFRQGRCFQDWPLGTECGCAENKHSEVGESPEISSTTTAYCTGPADSSDAAP